MPVRTEFSRNNSVMAGTTVLIDPNVDLPEGPEPTVSSLKDELKIWCDGVTHFEDNNLEEAYAAFKFIADSARFHFNMAMIAQLRGAEELQGVERLQHQQDPSASGTAGEGDGSGIPEVPEDDGELEEALQMRFQSAVEHYTEAITKFSDAIRADPYLAVADFQKGVCLYIAASNQLMIPSMEMGMEMQSPEERQLALFHESMQCFNDAMEHMRGNNHIDYTQLGLEYKLYSCEILYNRGLSRYHLGFIEEALADFNEAVKSVDLPEHDTISDALNDLSAAVSNPNTDPQEAEELLEQFVVKFRPFQVPQDKIYKPPKGKVQNSRKKDYLGTAKVVAAVSEGDSYVGFSGAKLGGRRPSEKPQPEEDFQMPRKYSAWTLPRLPQTPGGPNTTLGINTTMTRGYATVPRNHSVNSASTPQLSSGLVTPNLRRPSAPAAGFGLGRGFAPMMQSSPFMGSAPVSAGFSGSHQLNPAMNEQSIMDGMRNMTIGRNPNNMTIKCHYESDIRKISVAPDTPFTTLLSLLHEKFKLEPEAPIKVQYKDDDGDMIRMKDDEDWQLACSAAKVEIWVSDE